MSDPYTTQDKDYLTTTQHRTQTSATAHRGDSGAATPSFLSAASRTDTSSSGVDSQSAQSLTSAPGTTASSSPNSPASATVDNSSASLHSASSPSASSSSSSSSSSEYSQQQQQQQRSLEIGSSGSGRCTQPSDASQVSGNISRRQSNALITSSDLSWSAAVPGTLPAISTATTEIRSNSGVFGGLRGYSGSASAPLPQCPQQSAADAGISAPGLVRRGTKRRGSDTCIVLLSVGDGSSNTLDDTYSQSPASTSPFPCAKRVYRARSTLASRKSRKMIATNASSPSLFAEFGSSSVSAPASTLTSPSTAVGFERSTASAHIAGTTNSGSSGSSSSSSGVPSAALSGHGSSNNPKDEMSLSAATGKLQIRTSDAAGGYCGSLHRPQGLLGAHDIRGKEGSGLADAAAAGRGEAAHTAQHHSQASAEEVAAENSISANAKTPPVSTTVVIPTASSAPESSGSAAAHPTTDEGHAPHRALSGSASETHVTDGVCTASSASSGAKVHCVHEHRSSAGGQKTALQSSSLSSSAMVVDDKEMPLPATRGGPVSGSGSSVLTSTTATSRLGRSASAPASLPPAGSSANTNMYSHFQKYQHQQQQQRKPVATNGSIDPAAANSAAGMATPVRTQVCALPPINRYTLRELKIQNILQNPRLRHEVLFEPKLEFRPNSCGQLADAKQRAAQQYWAVVEQAVKLDASALSASPSSSVATITMLIVEIREIIAEMAEDSPKPELVHHAADLRERLDEQRIRQQLENRVFDAAAVVTYIVAAMEQFAQTSRKALVARVLVYVQRGRFVRALRAAFDILECIKIDAANRSIEMYREYMRSTAVAFERSHFNMALRRNTLELNDTTEWWRRALAECKKSGGSLEEMFREAGRELILDDGQATPGLFRMDETRIQIIRKEAERLSIVGMVFLAFVQFVQMARRNGSGTGQQQQKPGGGSEFINAANGRIDHERLAAECLQLVPEGCTVKWTESLLASRASPAKAVGASSARSSGGTTARGEVGFSHLVSELVFLAERTLVRGLTGAEIAMLERTLLRTARYECPLREVVEERINAAVRLHTDSLTALCGKVQGSEWEAMPQGANDILRKAMLSFLAPALSTLSVKISSVISHHWQVYKTFYIAVSTSASSSGKRNNSKGSNSGSNSNDSSNNGRGGASAETPSNASSSASTIHAA
ncbi:cAMP-mediated signaling protein sok1 [Coemansia sp. RSA 1813]|nr:cAMP-mediated signaling protein sok1 [Coemansia sp. RSA 1843]KAJ2091667.1 cAMP-mediated signaling protein sok1 [Coemansia sp. RSA 986]KAJ2216931.1 cAMP-mediated signaling protein sok1 [Coemansia sp. RSA 487]KAJ2571934.1 cAMP-mediated signaling protein sok1 [Coemansia sp. RSA 1813]